MKKDYTTLKQINYLLNRRCDFLLMIIEEIRDYLIDCKQNKSKIDIDKLINMLD